MDLPDPPNIKTQSENRRKQKKRHEPMKRDRHLFKPAADISKCGAHNMLVANGNISLG